MKRTAVIMAGGSGERFWPLSRKRKPKQLLKLASENKMMLEESIERISSLIPPEDIFIITGSHLLEPIRRALPILPAENIVAEPFKRNTAPCLALAAAFIAERYKEENLETKDISISVLTADQDIQNVDGFISTVESALNYVETNPVLATVGIQPSRPETGYGYIEVNESFSIENEVAEIKSVLQFHEKPTYDKALEYLHKGNYLWNSGMFFWRLDTFINSMEKCLPEVGSKISEMQIKYQNKTRKALLEAYSGIESIFENFPNISIDYGLMEKADNVVVTKALFTWDDIGSWDSLDRIRPKDENGNIISGNTAIFDTKNSIIINESSNNKIVVSSFGINDIVVVVTDDAVMLCPKNRVQDVKKSVEIIKNKYGDKWI
jgi:mannose-1-phosphate guanylyltransferase